MFLQHHQRPGTAGAVEPLLRETYTIVRCQGAAHLDSLYALHGACSFQQYLPVFMAVYQCRNECNTSLISLFCEQGMRSPLLGA